MKTFFIPVSLMILVFTGFAETNNVIVYDLQTGEHFDITWTIRDLTGFQNISELTSVNIDHIDGDEWLLVAGDDQYACIDLTRFTTCFYIDEWQFRTLLGLPGEGQGCLTAITKPDESVDTLLYFNVDSGKYVAFNLDTFQAEDYSGPELPAEYISGFSYTSLSDIGFFHNHQGIWTYESFEGSSPVYIDFESIFGGIPEYVTELEYTLTGSSYRFLLAAFSDNPDPSTPTPSPNPTSTPADNFKAVIAMGLDEDLWTVDGADYSVTESVALTGAAPNQILVDDGRFFVVNSLSNAIGVYDSQTCSVIDEYSVGEGRNPFAMAISDDGLLFVSNFIRNTISCLQASDGQVIREISLPETQDLPHDPGETTYCRPSGIAIAGDTCFVACSNLNDEFVAAGPGIICEINTQNLTLESWFESGGRNAVNVYYLPSHPDWIWIINSGDYIVGEGYSGNGNICIWSIADHNMFTCIEVSDAPLEAVFSPDRLYFSSAMDGRIGRVDLNGLSCLSPILTPHHGQGMDFISGLAIDPKGIVWVLEFNYNVAYLMDPNLNDSIFHSVSLGWGPDAIGILLP
ncbi:hypothetical protein JW979_04390 [bacterium]|nr:hypothetical protein [candidate division CSSED10-310 bacterium]